MKDDKIPYIYFHVDYNNLKQVKKKELTTLYITILNNWNLRREGGRGENISLIQSLFYYFKYPQILFRLEFYNREVFIGMLKRTLKWFRV